MDKILLQIKQAIEIKGISETTAATMAGLKQVKVNRMLAGKTKKIDMGAVQKLQKVLGIVSEDQIRYGISAVHRAISPEEENLLNILKDVPDIKLAIESLAGLPERKIKKHLGKILEDLEKIEEGKE